MTEEISEDQMRAWLGDDDEVIEDGPISARVKNYLIIAEHLLSTTALRGEWEFNLDPIIEVAKMLQIEAHRLGVELDGE